MTQRKDTFEHFYLTKVALGDCCGCAERVIDWRDIDMAARERFREDRTQRYIRPTLWRSIKYRFSRTKKNLNAIEATKNRLIYKAINTK